MHMPRIISNNNHRPFNSSENSSNPSRAMEDDRDSLFTLDTFLKFLKTFLYR